MSKLSSLLLAAMIFISASSSLPAQAAAPLSADGAVALKKTVEDALAYPLETTKISGQGLVMAGTVEVTPKDSFYEVHLPKLALVFQQGGKLDIGTVIVNATPAEDGSYLTSLALPTPMTFYDETNAPVAELSIGSQRFAGAWRPALDIYTKVDAEYKDIAIKSTGKVPFNFSLGQLRSVMDLTRNEDGSWSGPNNFGLSDIRLNVTDDGALDLKISSLIAKAVYDKVRLEGNKEIKDKALAMLKNSPQQPNPEDMKKFMDSLMQGMHGLLDGMSSDFSLNGLTVDIKPSANPAPGTLAEPVHFSLGTLSSAFGLKGLLQQKGSAFFKLGMDQLAIDNLSADIAGMVPTASNVEISLDNLPMNALSAAFTSLVSSAMDTALTAQNTTDAAQKAAMEQKMQAATITSMATIPQALVDAGATLSIKNTFTKAPDISSTLDGQFTANAASPTLATGVLTLAIKGMDELILKLQTMAQAPNANPKIMGYVQGLVMLQMMGQQETTPEGKSLRSYKLEVTPDGKTLMNGSDLSAMTTMMGGGAPAP